MMSEIRIYVDMFPVAGAKNGFAQTLCFAFLRRTLHGTASQSQDYR
jgi:hypothetical protein